MHRLAALPFLVLALACSATSPSCPGDDASDGSGTADVQADDAAADGVSPRLPSLPLRTWGRWIVGADGVRVRLSGVNWQAHHAVDRIEALDQAEVREVAARLARFGLTAVRLTWSNEGVETDAPLDPAFLGANPGLVGKTYLQGLDAVVDALGAEGLLVILNNHMSDAGPCCSDTDGNALWYNERYPETAWIADWTTLARRYRDRPWVVGADLRNEVRSLAMMQWGGQAGERYDWPSAAERCGNALLAVNPDLLIVVEGASYAKFLQGVKERPIRLEVPARVVYSAHDYPWHHRTLDGAADNWTAPGELYDTLDAWWGYLLEEGQAWTAPVWLGEFGDNPDVFTDADQWRVFGRWLMVVLGYVALRDLDWALWNMSVSGDEGLFVQATGAINDPVYAALLQSQIAPRGGPGIHGAPPAP
jgi:endoglucanase